MHTFGHPCRIEKIIEICDRYNVPVIEDAAESLGSYYKGRHTGTFGKIGVLSFNGNKTITTGGGGMLLFNDLLLAQKAKHLTTQAKVSHKWEFIHDEIGYNYRMPNINAALGLAQLEKIDYFINEQRKTASEYNTFFDKIGINFFNEPENANSNYWLNTIILTNRKERDEFLEYTNKNGIMTRPIWELMNRLPMFKDCQKKVYTILQLRLHESIIALKQKIENGPKDKIYDVDLTYLTSRGHWYYTSWKGDVSKSGGIASNIGVHFCDMLFWVFGSL